VKKRWVLIAAILVLSGVLVASATLKDDTLYSITDDKTISLSDASHALKTLRLIFVGEHHTDPNHHAMQLAVIRSLVEAGTPVAIGMEMFRSDAQRDLNRWSNRQLDTDDFTRIYYDNWNYDWALYAPILEYARNQRLPVVGLNLSRAITQQVAKHGFKSLSEEQRGKLDEVACRVDKTYMAFIRRAYGAHAHGTLDFTFFCEAQLVWDNTMAINAIDYLTANPDTVMVVVTGNGHAWKGGIPAQVKKRSDLPLAVILPEIEGITEPGMVDNNDADYIFLR
jgi:uncharacterized iron-regulated protein